MIPTKILKFDIILIILSSIITSCNNSIDTDQILLNGNQITLQYNAFKLSNLDSTQWLKIDSNKFKHFSDIATTNNTTALPTYKSITHKAEGKTLQETVNIINLGTTILKHLKSTKKYVFLHQHKTYINGEITFKRKDETKIEISFPKNYPIKIKTSN